MYEDSSLRADLIWVCRQLCGRGLVAATDGNVSCRCEDGSVLITPSGIPKGELEATDLLRIDDQGQVVAGARKPSSEFRMHLAVYERRPDVGAIVHAHPPLLTAFTLAAVPFVAEALPEVWLNVGPVPTAPYATPSTSEVVASIARKQDDTEVALELMHELKKFSKLTLIDLDDDLADYASEIAAKHRLRGSDAVYAAVALRFGAELITLDKEQLLRLPKVLTVRKPK